jgi:hypothetical protein
MRSFPKAQDDRAVQGGYSRWDGHELRPHTQHRTELTKFGPASARDQVCQDVGVAVKMRDSKAPIQGAPFGGGDEVLIGFNDDGTFGGLRSENSRCGESIGVKVNPGGRRRRSHTVEMRIEGKHVEGRAQELEDGYRKEGDI